MTLTELGSQFREARVHRGLLIEDVAAKLKISSKILRSIEDGERDELPQLVFMRGFIKSYGLFLGFSLTDLQKALLFLEETEPKFVPKMPPQDETTTRTNNATHAKKSSNKKAVLNILLLLLIVGGAVYFYKNLAPQQVQTPPVAIVDKPSPIAVPKKPSPQPDPISQIKPEIEEIQSMPSVPVELTIAQTKPNITVEEQKNTTTVTSIPTDIPPKAQEILNSLANTSQSRTNTTNNTTTNTTPSIVIPEGSQVLIITAQAECWLGVSEDKARQRDVMLKKGNSTTITYKESLVLKLGNAGGVTLNLNGKDLPFAGKNGQVTTLRFP